MELYAVKTWFDRHEGVVTLTDDVLGVVKDIKAIDDRLMVFYNPQTSGYDIVERCLDHTDRLVFSVAELDQRVVNRLRLADHWGGNDTPDRFIKPDSEDFATTMEEDNEALLRKHREEYNERIAEAGERIAWALDLPLKGNVGKGESIFVKESPLGTDAAQGDPS